MEQSQPHGPASGRGAQLRKQKCSTPQVAVIMKTYVVYLKFNFSWGPSILSGSLSSSFCGFTD